MASSTVARRACRAAKSKIPPKLLDACGKWSEIEVGKI